MLAIKDYEDLTIRDDFMFCYVFKNNPKLCKELISIVTGDNVDDFDYIGSQEAIQITADARGVRLDIMLKAKDGTIYNVEMQNLDKDDIAKRMRYYQSCIDLRELEKGTKFRNLPRSIIVFLCNFDFKGEGKLRYVFRETAKDGTLLGDGTEKIIVNLPNYIPAADDALNKLCDFFVTGSGKTEYTVALADAVAYAKRNKEWRADFMTLQQKYDELYDEAKEEGFAEGLAKGEEKGAAEAIERIQQALQNGASIEEALALASNKPTFE